MNNREIELKFGVVGSLKHIKETLSSLGSVSNEQVDNLKNIYFDTPSSDLFSMRAGLRIREASRYAEQTLKIRGLNLGGMHERNEYNIRIEKGQKCPDLHLFPADALPADFDLEDVQGRLQRQCEVDFQRHSFDLDIFDCIFEVSYDKGHIMVDDDECPIDELEVELKSTKRNESEMIFIFNDLLALFAEHKLPLTLEPFSKMHRATLLYKNERNGIKLPAVMPHNLDEFILGMVKMFETLLGLFYVKKQPAMLGYISYTLKTLIKGLKQLRRELKYSPLADYELNEVIRVRIAEVVKDLDALRTYTLSREDELMHRSLNGDLGYVYEVADKLRYKIFKLKIYTVPLRIRALICALSANHHQADTETQTEAGA